DGAAPTGALAYALTITNDDSGLAVTDGEPITLSLENGVVVGRVSGGGAMDGQAAFAIAIDGATGKVTVEQYLSLQHPDTGNPDDAVHLDPDTLAVTVTVTDGDGDT